jgi:hypothetical protein
MPYGFSDAGTVDDNRKKRDGSDTSAGGDTSAGSDYAGMLEGGLGDQTGASTSSNGGASHAASTAQDAAQGSGDTFLDSSGSTHGGGSGYLNFSDFYNANEGQAKAGASSINNQVNKDAQSAGAALSQTTGTFNDQAKAGTPQGPNAYDSQIAGSVDHGTTTPGADWTVSTSAPQVDHAQIDAQHPEYANLRAEATAMGPDAWAKKFPGQPYPGEMKNGNNGITADTNKTTGETQYFDSTTGQRVNADGSTYVQGGATAVTGQGINNSVGSAAANALARGKPTSTITTPTNAVGTTQQVPGAVGSAAQQQKLAGIGQAVGANPDAWAQAANGAYTGPNSIEDLSGYQGLLNQTTNAQGEVNALGGSGGDLNAGIQALAGPGANQWDAALYGAAGRPEFAQTTKEYGNGTLSNALSNEDLQSSMIANNDKALTQNFTDPAYQNLIDQYDTNHTGAGTTTQGADTGTNPDALRTGIKNFNSTQAPSFANDVRTVGEDLDPVAWIMKATGNQTPEEYFNTHYLDTYAPGMNPNQSPTSQNTTSENNFQQNGGNAAQFAQMTPADWAAYNALTDDKDRKAWIASHPNG